MRRAVISISSNIAEGFSRHSSREKLQFYHIAKGSLTEVESQLDLAWRVGYINEDVLNETQHKALSVGRLITALMRSIPD